MAVGEVERRRYWEDRRPELVKRLILRGLSDDAAESAADVYIQNMLLAQIDSVEEAKQHGG